MKLKVYSVDYSYNEEKMLEYRESLTEAGIHVCDFVCPEPKYRHLTEVYIVVDINTCEDFVKITDAVGQIIFDGATITIYDGYCE